MKKIARILATFGVVFGVGLASAQPVEAMSDEVLSAPNMIEAGMLSSLKTVGITFKDGQSYDSTCESNLFGMRPWYAGLSVKINGKCAVGEPKDDDELTTFIWMVILNVMSDIMVVIGYLALGFIIYGGYLYMLSGGDVGKVAKGKKTLIGAAIGLGIALLASGIVNTILRIIGA